MKNLNKLPLSSIVRKTTAAVAALGVLSLAIPEVREQALIYVTDRFNPRERNSWVVYSDSFNFQPMHKDEIVERLGTLRRQYSRGPVYFINLVRRSDNPNEVDVRIEANDPTVEDTNLSIQALTDNMQTGINEDENLTPLNYTMA